MTDEIDRLKGWLSFVDALPRLEAAPREQWLRVRGELDDAVEDRYDSAAFIPTTSIDTILEDPDWDDHDAGPEVWSDGSGKNCRYFRMSESGIEPLVLVRSFSGLRPFSVELLEEFRLFHNLYFDSAARQYLKLDDAGDPIIVAKVSADSETVDVLTRSVREFMAWKEAHLALYVVWNRYSEKTLEDLGLSEVRRAFIKDDRSIFSLTTAPCDFRDGYKSIGRLTGKVLVPPLSREKSNWGPFENEPEYQDFIVGVDEDGSAQEMSCAPEVSEARFLTRVWFRAEVLKKYRDEPTRYRVEDGLVACQGRWNLSIDNDHLDHVVAFLGDLRMLPDKEQRHWRAHNVVPAGRLSNTAFRRSFLAEWVSSDRPEHKFARAYESFIEACQQANFQIIRPLNADDEHCLKTLHVPPTEEVLAFDHQVGNLTKLLVDSM